LSSCSAARALARALSRWWLPTLAAITLAGSWIYVGYAFSKVGGALKREWRSRASDPGFAAQFTFALYLNSSGLLAMYFAHKRVSFLTKDSANEGGAR
jgi:hypothetical protein